MVPINVGDIQDYIDMKRLIIHDDDNSDNDDDKDKTKLKVIRMNDLIEAGMTKVNKVKFGIKLLSKGKERFRTPIKIEVSRASREAIECIENVGGQVKTVHYTRLSLRALLKPHKFAGGILPKNPLPPPRLMPYYTDYDNRGYLSPQVQKRDLLEKSNKEDLKLK